jgi:hypothetical protein
LETTLPFVSVGDVITYRFVARDAAAAGNVAFSNPAFDSLLITRDLLDDFENGVWPYASYVNTNTYRDAWHPSQESSSPPGGTAMKCGGGDGVPYPPHLDAALQAGFIPAGRIQPGALLRFDHRYELEAEDATRAWDGARVEAHVGGSGTPIVLHPLDGYTHTALTSPLGTGTPCWSGSSGGWRTTTIDLSPLVGSSPSTLRFRMATDNFIAGQGWFIDNVRWILPDGPTAVTPALSTSPPWPNPAHDLLRMSALVPATGRATWSLFDIAGRRVLSLWEGRLVAGARADLTAPLPAGLGGGIYFSRLELDGTVLGAHRIAIVR